MDQQDKIEVFHTRISVNFPKNGNRHSAQDQMCYIFALHIEPNGSTGQNRVFQAKIRVKFQKNGNRHSAQDQMCYIFALHIEPNGPT